MSRRELCLTAKDLFKEIGKKHPNKEKKLLTEEIALIVFPNTTINYLKKMTDLEEKKWLMDRYSLYASPTDIWTGKFNQVVFNVVRPPMGDSAVAAITEQLIACGTRIILLVCGAWGLQEEISIGDVLVPTVSRAQNKVANSYSESDELVPNKRILSIILDECCKMNINYYKGKNVALESFYRIKKKRVEEEIIKGSISAENGELHTVLTIAKHFQIEAGAIFYNYFKPLSKNHLDTPEELFISGGETIAKIALNTLELL